LQREDLGEILVKSSIIAAIRNDSDLECVSDSEIEVVFVLYGDIISIGDICKKLKNKKVFIHIDMISGLKIGTKSIEFIKNVANPYGIISTKMSCIKYAVNLGLFAILRVFLIDSQSLNTGINNTKISIADAVEVLPGIAYTALNDLRKEINIPIIAGGLIKNKKNIIDSINAGATAVSTSSKELWNLI
jgi:glycerol uptake operon antiterminator